MTFEDKQKIEQAVRTLADMVNGYSTARVAEVMLDTLCSQHRTLQQSLMGSIKMMIESYAGRTDVYFDPRNAEARAWAKEVLAITDAPSRRLPGRLPVV